MVAAPSATKVSQVRGGILAPRGGNVCSRFSGAEPTTSLGLLMADRDGVTQMAEFWDALTEELRAGLIANPAVFDKRVLVPTSLLPEMVKAETKEELPAARLQEMLDAGWIPSLTVEETGEPGFSLYAPSRVGLFLQLERAGYGASELQAIASYEEDYIDNILVADDTPYLDDDRELLLNEWRIRLTDAQIQLEHVKADQKPWADTYTADGLEREIKQLRRSIDFLESRAPDTMTPELREKTARMAYRVRIFYEILRTQLLEHLRGQVRAGYSPLLHFRRASYPANELPTLEGVMWDGVLDSPWVEEGVPIRLPELLLDGDRIIQLRPLRPSEYEELWV